jgi:hypothetical protein
MPIKSFRGKLADGAVETIPLHTNNGSTGYRIVKFEIVTDAPSVTSEHLCQIWSTESSAEAGKTASTIDFSDNTLLAVALWSNDSSAQTYSDDFHVVFDNMTFNQDIYVTNQTINGSNGCNYHIELEQIKLSLDENTVATLKDIRNIVGQ